MRDLNPQPQDFSVPMVLEVLRSIQLSQSGPDCGQWGSNPRIIDNRS